MYIGYPTLRWCRSMVSRWSLHLTSCNHLRLLYNSALRFAGPGFCKAQQSPSCTGSSDHPRAMWMLRTWNNCRRLFKFMKFMFKPNRCSGAANWCCIGLRLGGLEIRQGARFSQWFRSFSRIYRFLASIFGGAMDILCSPRKGGCDWLCLPGKGHSA